MARPSVPWGTYEVLSDGIRVRCTADWVLARESECRRIGPVGEETMALAAYAAFAEGWRNRWDAREGVYGWVCPEHVAARRAAIAVATVALEG